MNESALQKVEDFINDIHSLNPEYAEIIELDMDLYHLHTLYQYRPVDPAFLGPPH